MYTIIIAKIIEGGCIYTNVSCTMHLLFLKPKNISTHTYSCFVLLHQQILGWGWGGYDEFVS